jgi:transcriptional regulator with XRE-family HTH domain
MARARKTDPPKPREPHPDLEGFPYRLAEALRGREQKWLAERSQVDKAGISRMLRGEALVGIPGDTIIRLARALGVSTGWLLAGDGPKAWVYRAAEPGEMQAEQHAPPRNETRRPREDRHK